jgi:hypothetical protein
MGKLKLYIGLFISLIALLFFFDKAKPKPVNWSPSFNETHKRPWGTYIVHNELSQFFPEASNIEDELDTPYEKFFYKEEKYSNCTYIFIDKTSDIDTESIEELIEFAGNGNKVLIAAESMPTYLLDTLHVKLEEDIIFNLKKDSLTSSFYFANKNLKDKYSFRRGVSHSYFKEIDPKTTHTLGFYEYERKEFVNFIEVKYREGYFYLNTQPYAFTNYHLLKDNHANYVSSVFSYVDNRTIFWDAKRSVGLDQEPGLLRYILSEPTLSAAWKLGVAGLLLFVFFMARRRQRIVPVISPLPNTSVAFAKTIGNMYYQEGEPKDIISKKINFFLERLRTNYLLDTQHLDDEFKRRLHQKTGIEKEEIDRLVNYIIFLNNKQDIQEVSLVTLNKMIDRFDSKTL